MKLVEVGLCSVAVVDLPQCKFEAVAVVPVHVVCASL